MMNKKGQTPPPNGNFKRMQNFEPHNNYPQQNQIKKHNLNKNTKQKPKGLSLLIAMCCILAVLIVVYIILHINVFSYKSEITDVLTSSGNSDVQIIEDIKVDDNHFVYVFKDSDMLSASYIQIKGSGENKSYKCLKRCDSINLKSYKKDMQDEDINYSSKGDFSFGLDFSGSEQFSQFEEYFKENSITDYKACPVNIEGINQIFIVWIWNE